MKLLIIGGSDAGISAALRARELRPDTEVTIVVRDTYPNFSICGIPFHIGGEVPDWHALAHRTADDIINAGIELLLEHTALGIDPSKTVRVRDAKGTERHISYGSLVIATGAEPFRPPIAGMDLEGVFTLRWMDDSHALSRYLDERAPDRAVIAGAGYIGMEMAEALTRRGLAVTVIERDREVMPTLDPSLGALVRAELERHGITVRTGELVRSIERKESSLRVSTDNDSVVETGLVLVAAGARPETALARATGIETGVAGAIVVDRRMATNHPGIFAAGDCVETWHRLLEAPTYLPLGTTAHRQGRIAGENAMGGGREYEGTLGTQAVKVFDLVAARTGFNDTDARQAGFDPLTVRLDTWDHKVYYPGAHTLTILMTGDRTTGRFLGMQIVGHRDAEVSKRIDIAAVALHHGMRIDELSGLDLSYTPPLSSPWDPVQMAAQKWELQRRDL